jgi:sigma-B regulation protein RsbU (phosphoserine phosphatase)
VQVFIDLFVELVKTMAVIIMVAYLFTRTRLYRQVLDRRLGRQGRALLILIFGAFSIWGTLAGVDILGGIATTRDLGPALGGMFGEERLVAALGGGAAQDGAAHMMAAVRAAVDGFTDGAEQYDDITMLGFRRTRGAC